VREKAMRRFRILLTAILGVFIAIDGIVGYRLWESGWPRSIALTSQQKGVEQVQVTAVPFTGTDWLILILLVAFHALLCYLVWRAWRSSPVQA
jgi:Flp pilus assembly protein CpaB